MKVAATELEGVKVVEPRVFGDERGFFLESWNARAFDAAGLAATFVQDNHSGSRRGVLRGLHYQVEHAQGKLVRVAVGEVYDVVVDDYHKGYTGTAADRIPETPAPGTRHHGRSFCG